MQEVPSVIFAGYGRFFMTENKKSVTFLMMSILFIIGFEAGCLQYNVLKIANEFGLSYTRMSLFFSVECISYFLCVVIVGPFSDRIGKITVLKYAVLLFAAASILAVFSNSALFTYFVISLIGMSFGLCETVSLARVSDMYEDRKDQMIMIAQSMYSLGSVAGPLYIAFAQRRIWQNWRLAYIHLAVIMLAVAAALFRLDRKEKARSSVSVSGGAGRADRSALKDRRIITAVVLLMICMFCYAGMENGIGGFVDTLFEHKYGAPELSAAALSGLWFAMLVARLVSALFKKGQKVLMFIMMVVTLAASVFLYNSTSPQAGLWAAVAVGAGFGPIWPLLFSFMVGLSPENSGFLGSILTGTNAFAAGIVPLIMGRLSDVSGNVNQSVAVLCVLALICIVAYTVYLGQRRFWGNRRIRRYISE